MGKKQNRRSISITGPTYRRLSAVTAQTGEPRAAIIERLLVAFLDELEIEDPGPPVCICGMLSAGDRECPVHPPTTGPAAVTEFLSNHFTF